MRSANLGKISADIRPDLSKNNPRNSEGAFFTLKNSDILADVPAIKNDNIIVIDLTDVTGCYRSVDAIETMAKAFHPDCF